MYLTQTKKFFPANGVAFGMHPSLQTIHGTAQTLEQDGLGLRWYQIPAAGSAVGWIIVYHGNRDGAYERIEYAEHLAAGGMNVVLAEYPGYAGDSTKVGEWPILRHALAIYDAIAPQCQGLPLFLLGESLGTAPATFVASRRPCKGLVLSTPYTSMAAVAAHRYPLLPVGPLTRHRLQAELWAPHVSAPVLVLQGTKDRTIPFAMARTQAGHFSRLRNFVSIPGAGHGNIRSHAPGLYWDSINDFLQGCLNA